MSGRLVTGDTYNRLFEILEERIRREKRQRRHGRVYVLASSNLSASQTRRMLADRMGALFNVDFMTFADLVSAVEEGAAPESSPPIPPRADELILRHIISSGNDFDYFDEISDSEGFFRFILGTLTDLSESGMDSEQARRILSSSEGGGLPLRVRSVLSLYARYRESVRTEGGDFHERFRRAVGSGGDVKLEGPLLVYGFYDFNQMQIRLLESLSANNHVELMVIGGGGRNYSFTAETLSRLEKAGFAGSEPSSGNGGKDAGRDPGMTFLKTADEEEEAREIVRMVLEAAGGGVPLWKMAVIYPSAEQFGPVTEVLEEAGIPFYSGAGRPVERKRILRSADLLIDFLGSGIARRDLVEFFLSAPLVASPETGMSPDLLRLWVRRSAEAGMTGENGWLEENAGLIERLRGRGDSEGVLCAQMAAGLLERIEKASRKLRKMNSWKKGARAAEELFAGILEEGDDLKDLVEAAWSLGPLDSLNLPLSSSLFRSMLRKAVRETVTFKGGFERDGLNLLPIERARGLKFERIFLAGLTDDAIPGRIGQDPFLGDSERANLNRLAGEGVFLQDKLGRLEELELVFTLITRSAEERVVLSTPMFSAFSGKKKIESYLVGLAGERSRGSEPSSGSSDGAAGTYGSQTRKVLRDDIPSLFVSAGEFDYFRAFRARQEGKGCPPFGPFFGRASRMLRNRYQTGKFTPWDGVFATEESRKRIKGILQRRDYSFSATSMERYSRCPFAFLCGNLLGVESLEEPEKILRITPLQRGALVHRILEKVYSELASRNLLPLRMKHREEVMSVFFQVAGAVLREYSYTDPTGLRFIWEMDRKDILRAIGLFLEREFEEESDLVPSLFEREFGSGKAPVEIRTGGTGRTVRFRGRIDRVDLGPGDSFRVIDYKTGRIRMKDNRFGGGDYLQLPVYLLGASALSGRPFGSGTAQYRVVSTRDGKDAAGFSGTELEKRMGRFEEIVETVIAGIERGLFFANPSNENCSYCAFGRACPTYAGTLFEGKARNDERGREYTAMREIE